MTHDLTLGDNRTQLYLGFDSSCSTCSAIARNVQRDTGSVVEVLPLTNQHMARWREDVFGDSAPWLPTLIRVSGGKVEGWTGWKIGPVLGRALGPKTAWQVLASLGSQQLDRSNGAERTGARTALTHTKSRRVFFKVLAGTVGAIAGAGMLAGRAAPAFAAPGQGDLSGSTPRTLTGTELADAAKRQLESADALNVLGSAPTTLQAGTERLKNFSLDSPDELERGGQVVDLDDGIRHTWTYVYSREDGIALYTQDFTSPVGDVGSASFLVRISDTTGQASDATFLILEQSINGAIPTLIPDDADIARAADPCGGCNGICQITGNQLRSSCQVESQLGCILGAAGCALCISCSSTVVCVGCVLTSCGGAVLSCCGRSEPACHRCVRVC
ncbi:hypothetical protein SAMN05421642_1253 [Rhodococcoides kyotonense]|uniref:Uncharacterized protein n=1 Tax=Rhodococcoides kyotonense TaxID=398843 RepID=A0A239N0P2_9NOCA|nr:hypothetical protein SAMN05421642_1253 [Rhodococcus kyotonensis]